jgi:hypothetical protein
LYNITNFLSTRVDNSVSLTTAHLCICKKYPDEATAFFAPTDCHGAYNEEELAYKLRTLLELRGKRERTVKEIIRR